MVNMLQKTRGVPDTAPLFTYKHDGKFLALTHYKFTMLLKSVLSSIGYNSDDYSGHSFRRAGCSFAYACGVPIHLIKLQGDWVSEAYQQYLSVPLEMRWKCVRVIAEHVEKIPC